MTHTHTYTHTQSLRNGNKQTNKQKQTQNFVLLFEQRFHMSLLDWAPQFM